MLCSCERALGDIPSLHLVTFGAFLFSHHLLFSSIAKNRLSSKRVSRLYSISFFMFSMRRVCIVLGMSVPEVLSPCSSPVLPAPPLSLLRTPLHPHRRRSCIPETAISLFYATYLRRARPCRCSSRGLPGRLRRRRACAVDAVVWSRQMCCVDG